MMSYQRSNIILGWVLFFVSTAVYMLTLEPTMPFWDCGEFIASAYKLEVGHPPGAPLFMLIARIASAFVSTENVPYAVNTISAISSGATIMFLFWSVTHLAKKMVEKLSKSDEPKNLLILGAGLIGGLAYAFSDTFWFSAVEGEVYAMSSLFTAVVFWAILKWENEADKPSNLRWIILIAYLMGLSIGVHLLNLLAIPAIAFVYYFKKYDINWKGVVGTGIFSLVLLYFVQYIIIPGLFGAASNFEYFAVNKMNLPFGSGAIVFFILLIGSLIAKLLIERNRVIDILVSNILIVLVFQMSAANVGGFAFLPSLSLAIYWVTFYVTKDTSKSFLYGITGWLIGFMLERLFIAHKNESEQKNTDLVPFVKLFIVCTLMILIGYSTFATIMIRSQANTPMNENKPDNLFALVSYLNREQYGDRPLFRGQYFNTPQDRAKPYVDGGDVYVKSYSVREQGKNKLVISFKSEFEANEYVKAHAEDKLVVKEEYLETGEKKGTVPNFRETHVFPRMYSSQGSHVSQYKTWAELKNLKQTPSFGENMKYFFRYQVNWMYWRYFMWNFAGRQSDIQGHGDFLDGNWKTGIGFFDEMRLGNQEKLPELYAHNKANNSYYLIPFILGMLGLFYHAIKMQKDFVVVMLLFLLTGVAIVVYLNQTPLQPRERDYAYAGSFYAFAIWIGLGVLAVYYIVRDLLGSKMKPIATASLALAFSFTAPMLMAEQGWDDHDRSDRRTGLDMAINYLESLAPNAIIFTNGDNDTFPLWYAQEVEGIRTDVRVVNLSLLNTDWYIDQMKRRQYNSAPVPFSMPEYKYRQGTRDLIVLGDDSVYTPLDKAMAWCLDESKMRDFGVKKYQTMPNNKFALAVSAENQAKFKSFVGAKDTLVNSIEFALLDDDGESPRQFITKAQMMVLDLILSNNWDRPIYFAVTTGSEAYMGLEPYFQLEGLAYRLTPIYHTDYDRDNMAGGVASDIMYDNIMNKFKWGNIDTKDIYLDENNRRMVTNLRMQMNNLADQYIREGDKERAATVLEKSLAVLPEKNAPYDQTQIMWTTSQLLFKAGRTEEAKKLSARIFELNNQMMDYYASLSREDQDAIERKMQTAAFVNEELVNDMKKYAPQDEQTKAMTATHDQKLDDVGLLVDMKKQRQAKEQRMEEYKRQKAKYDSLMKAMGRDTARSSARF